TDGHLVCWGADSSGSVSGPNASTDTFTQVSAGMENGDTHERHTCGLKTDGHLECWGGDLYGQVSGPNASTDTFTQVSAGGHDDTCAVKTDSHLICWGRDGGREQVS